MMDKPNQQDKPHIVLGLGGKLEPLNIEGFEEKEFTIHREIMNIYIIAIFITSIMLLITFII